jgi:hypothetical protein
VGLDQTENLLFKSVEVLFLQQLFTQPTAVAIVYFLARIILLEKFLLFLAQRLAALAILLNKDLFKQYGLKFSIRVQFWILNTVDLENAHQTCLPIYKKVPE